MKRLTKRDSEIERKIAETFEMIKKKLGRSGPFPELLVILGSGFKGFADSLTKKMAINIAEIPHFSSPSVEGHGSHLMVGLSGKIPVAVMTGRVHVYEGCSIADVVYPIRALSRLGVRRVLLTNASGSLRPDVKPGETLIIKDHINLTGQNCLIGKEARFFGPSFLDMGDCYNATWRQRIARKTGLREGVYCGVLGPTFETPAEAAFFGQLGADVIGMSTVQEAIAAHQLGLKVAGMTFVTNYSGSKVEGKLCHEEVLELAKANGPVLTRQLTLAIGATDL